MRHPSHRALTRGARPKVIARRGAEEEINARCPGERQFSRIHRARELVDEVIPRSVHRRVQPLLDGLAQVEGQVRKRGHRHYWPPRTTLYASSRSFHFVME